MRCGHSAVPRKGTRKSQRQAMPDAGVKREQAEQAGLCTVMAGMAGMAGVGMAGMALEKHKD